MAAVCPTPRCCHHTHPSASLSPLPLGSGRCHSLASAVPAVREDHLEATTTTNTTARDSFETGTGFSSRFSSTSSRRAPAAVDRTDLSDIDSVIKGSASGAVESWIRSAPGFEGEVVKRMLRTVSRQVATPGKSQARASKGGGAADFPSQLTTV